jgi:hypothetical protein
VFDKNAEIVEVPDDSSINTLAFNFTKLDAMIEKQSNSYVDFIGVLQSVGPASQVTTRAGVSKSKRIVQFADDTNLSVDCCVWAEHSDMFINAEPGAIVACKSAKLVDFN